MYTNKKHQKAKNDWHEICGQKMARHNIYAVKIIIITTLIGNRNVTLTVRRDYESAAKSI
jgi:hypothetical protein